MSKSVTGLLALLGFSVFASAGWAADARNGETLAKRWCATCHVVSADQTRGNTQAPPFSAIARQSGFDDARLALFLLTPHPRMPDMNLSRSEAADLVAYIKTQGR
jgi:mono/diheme cytochrome c family protein